MVIINRNDLTIRTVNRVNTRLMQGLTVTGYGAEVQPAGAISLAPTRPFGE